MIYMNKWSRLFFNWEKPNFELRIQIGERGGQTLSLDVDNALIQIHVTNLRIAQPSVFSERDDESTRRSRTCGCSMPESR